MLCMMEMVFQKTIIKMEFKKKKDVSFMWLIQYT